MVTITENSLIIEIEDGCPEMLLFKLKTAISVVLQHMSFESHETSDIEQAQFYVLEILNALQVDTETVRYL